MKITLRVKFFKILPRKWWYFLFEILFVGEETSILISMWVFSHFEVSSVWKEKMNLLTHFCDILWGFLLVAETLLGFHAPNGLKYSCLFFYAVLLLYEGPILWFYTIFWTGMHFHDKERWKKQVSNLLTAEIQPESVAPPTHRCPAAFHQDSLCCYIL